MKTVKIQRSKWLRGMQDGSGEYALSQLCDTEGHRCCLGFAIHQITKCPLKDLVGVPDPESYMKKPSFLTRFDKKWGKVKDNQFAQAAININDNQNIHDDRREERLIKLFKKNNLKLVFVD